MASVLPNPMLNKAAISDQGTGNQSEIEQLKNRTLNTLHI